MGYGLGFPSFGAQHGGHTSHQPDFKWDRIWLSVGSRGWERAEGAPTAPSLSRLPAPLP